MYTEYDYLAHFGVKGMRWGVRKERPINEQYNMNKERHRKKALKEYSHLRKRAQREVVRGAQSRWVDSYNSVARKLNAGGIAEYNKRNSSKDPEYINRYNRCVDAMVAITDNNATLKAYQSNQNYTKAQKMAKELNLSKYSKDLRDPYDIEKNVKRANAEYLTDIPSYMRKYMP